MCAENENSFNILSLSISDRRGTVKKPVDSIDLGEQGIIGDAHYGFGHRQVSILAAESINRFEKRVNKKFAPGEFAENIVIEGIDSLTVCLLDKFIIGSAMLEVTQIAKECNDDDCAVYRAVGKCIMSEEGIFCRVISGGKVKIGDEGTFVPRPLQIKVITVSDRASSGEYSDKSGPKIVETLENFFNDKKWRIEIETAIVPDDATAIERELLDAAENDADIIFTTGGTGIGSRDITPDVVAALCEKNIPGIMEHIRTKYGAKNPNALLSRSVAGIFKNTVIFTLPGSEKAVSEYSTEILPMLEHIIFMTNNIDIHQHH